MTEHALTYSVDLSWRVPTKDAMLAWLEHEIAIKRAVILEGGNGVRYVCANFGTMPPVLCGVMSATIKESPDGTR